MKKLMIKRRTPNDIFHEGKGKIWDLSAWIFISLIIGITAIILLVNNYTTVSVKAILEDTENHIKTMEKSLISLQDDMDQYGHVIESLAESKEGNTLLVEEVSFIAETFLKSNNLVSSSFFYMNGNFQNILKEDTWSQIPALSEELNALASENRQGLWKSITNPDTGDNSFLYLTPFFRQQTYLGYVGFTLSPTEVAKEMEGFLLLENEVDEVLNTQGFTPDTIISIKKDLEKGNFGYATASDEKGSKKMYSFYNLETGHVYMEINRELRRAQHSNEMILLISCFAVAAMWMIHINKRTRKTVFESVSDYIMSGYAGQINSIQKQGNKGTIALNLGMTMAIFADVLYSLALGREWRVTVEYALFFIMSAGVILFYKRNKQGISVSFATGLIIAGLLGPLAEHISAGGFSLYRAGESLLWFIICLFIGLFMLGVEKSNNVFYAFVVLLIFDVTMELLFFYNKNEEGIALFAISFILLGFSLFAAVGIYVSGAVGHYQQTENLIKQLKRDQNLLMQKEKLGALGQLISGVAHEINTPMGAIKASAENMEDSFMTILEEVLYAAEAFTEEEYDAYLKIVAMSYDAVGEMKSTLEIRAGKKEVKRYFEEMELDKKEVILDYLVRLELVDLEQIKENIEIFRMNKIEDILNRIAMLTPFITGIPTTLYSADRVAQIVQALKSYVHTSTIGEMVEFDLIKSIENVLILYRNQLKSNIHINRIYEKKEFRVMGNPDELAQVWTNLIQNAIQAMKQGGELTIEIKQMEEKRIMIMFQDTGEGISAEWLDKIYDPFFTTKETGEGSGLGLDISKKVIDRHHGELRVESQPEKGSRFFVYLYTETSNANGDIMDTVI